MATLTNEMLSDLHKGVAAISILEATATTKKFTSLNFGTADRLYTIKDSFSITEEEASEEEIKIDQGDAVIATDVEAGKLSFTGNCPTIAKAVFDYFYAAGHGAVASVTGTDSATYSGNDYSRVPQDKYVTVLVESESRQSAIVFANVKLRARMVHDDMDNPLYLAFTGTVLTNTEEGYGDFAVLHSASAGA